MIGRLPVVSLSLSLLGLSGCGGIHALARPDAPVVTLERFRADSAADGGLPPGGVIVRIDKGTRLPVNASVSAPFATLEPGDNRLRLDADVFVLLAPGVVDLSPDGKRWARVTDLRGLKRLFGVGKGQFMVGGGIDKASGPLVTVALKLLPR